MSSTISKFTNRRSLEMFGVGTIPFPTEYFPHPVATANFPFNDTLFIGNSIGCNVSENSIVSGILISAMSFLMCFGFHVGWIMKSSRSTRTRFWPGSNGLRISWAPRKITAFSPLENSRLLSFVDEIERTMKPKTHPYRQWAAVRTNSSEIIEPPHQKIP